MAGMINPLTQRAPGVAPRFTISETERILGKSAPSWRDDIESREGQPLTRCSLFRYECASCGIYCKYTLDPLDLDANCHHCGRTLCGVDVPRDTKCWTDRPLPHITKPITLRQPLVIPAVKIDRICEYCGLEFRTSKRNNYTPRFCSPFCSGRARRAMRGKK